LSNHKELPAGIINQAKTVFEKSTDQLINLHSSRGMAFSIKGLHFANHYLKSAAVSVQIELLADRLVQMYLHESEPTWLWFENYITYANSILPEALLCAYQETNKKIYGHIAKESFDFLLTLTIKNGQIKVVSNKYWLQKGEENKYHGEQPIDVAYTILSLKRFFDVFNDESYSDNIRLSFNWFLGSNHLRQIIYNPCTGGCYDGLEESQVNLNQGAESTLSYLMARLAVEQHFNVNRPY
jgi:hypothetical protein